MSTLLTESEMQESPLSFPHATSPTPALHTPLKLQFLKYLSKDTENILHSTRYLKSCSSFLKSGSNGPQTLKCLKPQIILIETGNSDLQFAVENLDP